jgi:integrase
MSSITLAGDRTKNGRLRKVPVPDYVREALLKREIDKLPADYNIFSGTPESFKQYYFNTAWTRAKKKMLKAGLIRRKQTLYSFRHTAVVQLYMRTRSLHRVKELMGHSSLQVTLTYMRSLGVEESRNAEPVFPELPSIHK